ncbi:MAG: hypothetical protein ACLRT4_16760 [Thomasclavelia sp.]
MKETYSKNYFEKYAALTLLKILNVSESQIIQSDRPDLRIPDRDFGIEVTQALTPQEAVADIKKPLYAILNINPFDHNEDDLEFVIKKIDNAIERKEYKSKNYQQYLQNGLYIFSHCHNLPKEMLIDYFNNNPLKESFYQHIYINCVNHLYHYHCKDATLIRYDYHVNELIKMNRTALEFEQHCHKPRRKIIV